MKLYRKDETEKIKEDLLNGQIIAFGTDTVFGLACVYDDPEAIEKIYEAKDRDHSKSLPMMCSDFEMIEKAAYINEKARRIMKTFMPGAITIIFRKKEEMPDYVTSGKDSIGIRIPDDEWILKLIDLVGKPLLVTSANISGEPPLFKWEEVKEKLEGRIDGLLMEDARGDASSTVVDCTKEDIRILREGPISIEEIEKAIKEQL